MRPENSAGPVPAHTHGCNDHCRVSHGRTRDLFSHKARNSGATDEFATAVMMPPSASRNMRAPSKSTSGPCGFAGTVMAKSGAADCSFSGELERVKNGRNRPALVN